MTALRTLVAAKAALSIALGAGPAIAAAATQGNAPAQPPAGTYVMDPAHSSLTFRVSHLGFSHYTARFSRLDGTLKFDPAHPEQMQVTAEIDPASLDLTAPPAGFHAQITGKGWLEAAQFPKITFRSTKVELAGPHAARVTGDLSLHGVSRPVVLQVTYNGGWPPNDFDPGGARVGFSAKGALKRSDFGISTGIPAPGTTMGVSDEVEVAIETEFSSKRAAE